MDTARAITLASGTARSLGLEVSSATLVQDSNRVVAVLRPCETMVRVADDRSADRFAVELTVSDALARHGAPVAAPERRVDAGPHCEPVDTTRPIRRRRSRPTPTAPRGAGFTGSSPLFAASTPPISPTASTRPSHSRWDRAASPALDRFDRSLVCDALSALRAEVVDAGAPEQLLHGEPHPDNVLRTAVGPLFTDFETCCSGPVEFDVADAPEAVAAHYPGLDPHLLDRCCWLVVAMVTSLCFGGYERHENLRRGAEHFYGLLAAAVEDGSVTL